MSEMTGSRLDAGEMISTPAKLAIWRKGRGRFCATLALALFLAAGFVVSGSCAFAASGEPGSIDRALTDITVLYVYHDPAEIDWATVVLLSAERSCAVTVACLHAAERFYVNERRAQDIRVLDVYLPPGEQFLASANHAITGSTIRPDIVIFPAKLGDTLTRSLWHFFGDDVKRGEAPRFGSLFGVKKLYRASDSAAISQGVIVNKRETENRHNAEVQQLRRELFPEAPLALSNEVALYSSYQLTGYNIQVAFRESDFLSGLSPLRLNSLIEKSISQSAARQSHISLAKEFQKDFDAARGATRKERVDLLVSGYQALTTLVKHTAAYNVSDSFPAYGAYLSGLTARAQSATIAEMGLDWRGDISVRETPQGPRVKFRASVTVGGSLAVTIARIVYQPSKGAAVAIETTPQEVRPHQQFVREYLIDSSVVDVGKGGIDSLRFAIEFAYGGITMIAPTVADLRGDQSLRAQFAPPFRFIAKTVNVFDDRSIEPFYWRLEITKPKYYSGQVRVDIKTPPGVATGSMQKSFRLTSGSEAETIQLPFVAGSSMADGISRIVVTLTDDRGVTAIDTAIIRVAECAIPAGIKVAFLPDSLGTLEDLLRMTNVDFTALTDRALEAAELGAYKFLALGSGCHRTHPSLTKVVERLRRFVRQGGTLIVLGQPEDWPADGIPLSITPTPKRTRGDSWVIGERGHALFSAPYEIYTRSLIEAVGTGALSAPATIEPGKRLIADTAGRSLINVLNMGEGRIIYCGFPLVEQVGALEINAIHLFANLFTP